jgi:hypothetical protein
MKRTNLNVWIQFSYFFDYVHVFSKKQDINPSNIEQSQHAGREGDQEQVRICCLQTTVCLSSEIDRQSVSVVIVRGLCDVYNNINSVTFITKEQNSRSLCPAGTPENFVVVRIPRHSVWQLPLLKILFSKSVKNQNRDPPTSRVLDKVFDESFCDFFIPTEDCFGSKIDGSRKHQETIQKLKVFEVLNECDFILSIQQSNSKIGKTKKPLTREMGNPTGTEIGVPDS